MRLKELRKRRGLTQSELAKSLGVSSQTILNWENGIHEPNITQLIQLSNIFNVSVDYLIGRNKSTSEVDELCFQLEKISYSDLIDFIKEQLKEMKNK